MNLDNLTVAAEFGGRASIIYDVNNGGRGIDCGGHGTQVASAAAGNTYGIAKGANIIATKITYGCGGIAATSTSILAFNWLAANAPRGTIANWSHEFQVHDANGKRICGSSIDTTLENSIRAAHDAGIIVVVAAGNDGCNTADYSPTRIPEAFVVGATGTNRLFLGQDVRTNYSRFGTNISTFAPGDNVALLNFDGKPATGVGTSFAAPYIAGIFAAGCQAAGNLCDTMPTALSAYNALRNVGVMETVVNADGSKLPASTPSRFINRDVW